LLLAPKVQTWRSQPEQEAHPAGETRQSYAGYAPRVLSAPQDNDDDDDDAEAVAEKLPCN